MIFLDPLIVIADQIVLAVGNLHYSQIFDPGKTNKTFYHSLKEHVKISKIAKFGCEML